MTGDRVFWKSSGLCLLGNRNVMTLLSLNIRIMKKELFIKRIIGMPGETVEIKDGKVYINGSEEPLKDSFTPETPVGDYGPYTVPEDSYFVLGDNRNYSRDSRFWNNPYVAEDKILGKAVLRYFPGIKLLK